jgi:hypothetical protein
VFCLSLDHFATRPLDHFSLPVVFPASSPPNPEAPNSELEVTGSMLCLIRMDLVELLQPI